jgi:hypothetical protein
MFAACKRTMKPLMLGVCLIATACQRGGEKTQDAAGEDVPMASDALRVCGAGFTACAHACGEKNDTELTAASCTDGVYSCPAPLIPAIDCGAGSWPTGGPAGCGPWVEGYDCTSSSVCNRGLWTCPGITDASAGDLTADGATDRDEGGDALGGPACGEHKCGAGQLCIYEYCGIGPSQCVPPGDGGVCPDRWILMVGEICPTTGKPGCVPPPCENPPPHCADIPAACGGRVDCSCIPTDDCDRIPCAMVSGTDVTCGAQ